MDAEEDTEVQAIAVAVVMSVVDEENVVEEAMVKTHMNLPAGMENSRQKLVCTLQTNADSSPCNKRIISKK